MNAHTTPESDEATLHLLRNALEVAVPMQIMTYLADGCSADWLIERANQAGEVIASEGDKLMLRTPGTKHRRGTAEVFVELVVCIAAGALVADRGIRIFGLHFDAELPDDTTATD